jgi:hypothetical protein
MKPRLCSGFSLEDLHEAPAALIPFAHHLDGPKARETYLRIILHAWMPNFFYVQ